MRGERLKPFVEWLAERRGLPEGRRLPESGRLRRRGRRLGPLLARPVHDVEHLARGVHLVAAAALRTGGNPNLVIHHLIMPRPWPFLKDDEANHRS